MTTISTTGRTLSDWLWLARTRLADRLWTARGWLPWVRRIRGIDIRIDKQQDTIAAQQATIARLTKLMVTMADVTIEHIRGEPGTELQRRKLELVKGDPE